MLRARAESGEPVRVGLIGAGKFGSMFLAQVRSTVGMHLVGVADLSAERARATLARAGWSEEQLTAPSFGEAFELGTTCVSEDSLALIRSNSIEVIVEATGSPEAGIRHALACISAGKHVVMVNVEADALAGPLLARRAREAGVVYSLAYGDQPALICEMVDWARACGFEVVCAGKGTKYLPAYHQSTPETVWKHFGWSDEEVARSGANAKMFNSFIDGTKSAIEMAAVSNATGLLPPSDGLLFPPAGAEELQDVLRPNADGGVLERSGTVEVVASLQRDGSIVERDLRWGVYVVFRGDGEYVRECFQQYGLVTDASGHCAALYRPYHLIGLEVGISVASAALRNEPTGAPVTWLADEVATAKRDLKAGERLDGEGGYCVWGKLIPAERSLAEHALPIGLAHNVTLINDVKAGTIVTWADIEARPDDETITIRREMESQFRPFS